MPASKRFIQSSNGPRFFLASIKIPGRKIIHGIGQSFSLVSFSPLQYPPHYHDQYERLQITSGSGKKHVGQAVEPFMAGELPLIGQGVLHIHLCDSMNDSSVKTESTCEVLYFPASPFPDNIGHIEEYRPSERNPQNAWHRTLSNPPFHPRQTVTSQPDIADLPVTCYSRKRKLCQYRHTDTNLSEKTLS